MLFRIEKLISKGDYMYALVYNHPNATKNNYVLHHRVVVENAIGRVLGKQEIVHHKDGNKKNNVIGNLEITDSRKHGLSHTKYADGHFVELVCPVCKIAFNRPYSQRLENKKTKNAYCSRRCNGKSIKERPGNKNRRLS